MIELSKKEVIFLQEMILQKIQEIENFDLEEQAEDIKILDKIYFKLDGEGV